MKFLAFITRHSPMIPWGIFVFRFHPELRTTFIALLVLIPLQIFAVKTSNNLLSRDAEASKSPDLH